MENTNLKLLIGNIFPKSLNLYGDLGNVTILKQRCLWRGIDVGIVDVDSDEYKPCDIYFIGSGTDSQLKMVAASLLKNKDFYLGERDKNTVFLATGTGYQILCNTFLDSVEGLGLLDCVSKNGSKRFVGNVTATTDLVSPNTIVGFENHSNYLYLYNDTKRLFTVSIGNGNNGEDKSEGAYYKNVFGTNLHGAFLAKNYHFADFLINKALVNKYSDSVILPEIDDSLECKFHEVLVGTTY